MNEQVELKKATPSGDEGREIEVWWCARFQRVEDNEGRCHDNRYGKGHDERAEGCGVGRLLLPAEKKGK